MLGLGLRSDHPHSASRQLIPSQLTSCASESCVLLLPGAGARSGDVWILSWGVRVNSSHLYFLSYGAHLPGLRATRTLRNRRTTKREVHRLKSVPPAEQSS